MESPDTYPFWEMKQRKYLVQNFESDGDIIYNGVCYFRQQQNHLPLVFMLTQSEIWQVSTLPKPEVTWLRFLGQFGSLEIPLYGWCARVNIHLSLRSTGSVTEIEIEQQEKVDFSWVNLTAGSQGLALR